MRTPLIAACALAGAACLAVALTMEPSVARQAIYTPGQDAESSARLSSQSEVSYNGDPDQSIDLEDNSATMLDGTEREPELPVRNLPADESFWAALPKPAAERLKRHGEGALEYAEYLAASEQYSASDINSVAWRIHQITTGESIEDEARMLVSSLLGDEEIEPSALAECRLIAAELIVDLRRIVAQVCSFYPDLESGLEDPGFSDLAQRNVRSAQRIVDVEKGASQLLADYSARFIWALGAEHHQFSIAEAFRQNYHQFRTTEKAK